MGFLLGSCAIEVAVKANIPRQLEPLVLGTKGPHHLIRPHSPGTCKRPRFSQHIPKKKKQENPRENPSPTHRFDPKHQRCTKSEKSHFQIPTAHGFKGNKSAFPYINQEVQQPREAHLSQRNLLWKKPWDSQLF